MASSSYHRPVSIPNILTLMRILLVPLFVILLLRNLYTSALLVFAVAGLSDGLDGLIARYMNQRTALGAYLDPAADKLLLVSAFIALGILGVIPAWMSVLVISRDVIIVLGIAILRLTEKRFEIKPAIVSKCTTTTQILTVLLALFDPTQVRLPALHAPMLLLTAFLTIFSGLYYVYIGMNILQEPAGTQERSDRHNNR